MNAKDQEDIKAQAKLIYESDLDLELIEKAIERFYYRGATTAATKINTYPGIGE